MQNKSDMGHYPVTAQLHPIIHMMKAIMIMNYKMTA
jgi:hypothetical protein